jgi:hypothetical protein
LGLWRFRCLDAQVLETRDSLPPVFHLLLRSHTLIRRLPGHRFSRPRNSTRKSLPLKLTNIRVCDVPMPLGAAFLHGLSFRHLSSTMIRSYVGKSGIGISRFLLSCAWDFHIPDPRLCRISRHVPQLTDGSDSVGQSRIAIHSCKSSLPSETPILRWTEIPTLLLMSDTHPAKING